MLRSTGQIIWPKHDKIIIATTAGNTRNWPKLLLHPKAEEKQGTRGWGGGGGEWGVKKGECSMNNKKFTETYSFSVSQPFQTYLQ